MKHKLGPLPVWAWALIAGGTLGIIWYLRTGTSTSPVAADPITDPNLPATAGAPIDVSGGGGTTDPTTAASGTTLDDLMTGIVGLSGDITALQGGGQGLTDGPSATQTFAGEVDDVSTGVAALGNLAALFAPPAAKKTAQKKKATAKKKSQGSGAAGKVAHSHKKPIRHTRKHVAAKKPPAKHHAQVGQVVATPTHHHAGGNAQHRRTAKPKHKRRG